MEKRIEIEKRQRPADKITELYLDHCQGCTSIVGLTDEFVNLSTLSIIGSGLTSLEGFPKLRNLQILDVSINKISGGLHVLKNCEQLVLLNLSENHITDLNALQDLKERQHLRLLDLFDNEIASTNDFRNKVFEMLPQITYLDGTDKNERDYEDSDGISDDKSDEGYYEVDTEEEEFVKEDEFVEDEKAVVESEIVVDDDF